MVRLSRVSDLEPQSTETLSGPPISRESLLLGGILLLGLLLRGWYLGELIHAPDFTSPALDAAFHDHWARGLAFGDWSVPAEYADPQIRTTPFFRPPGYAYFLGLLYRVAGPSYVGPRLIQMGLGLLNCILAFYLGRWLFGRAVGLLTALFMSFYWAFIYFEGELLAPPLVVFLALALLNVLVRWTEKATWLRGLAGGVLLGVFALVRPNVLLFAPVVLIWSWWIVRRRGEVRRYWQTAVAFVGGTAMAIAPATVRNYVVADDVVLISSNAGINLYIGNNERTDCVWPRLPGLREVIGRAGWTCFDHARIVEGVRRTEGRPMKHSEVSAYYTKKAIKYIKDHPLRVMGLTAKKALLFWGPAEISNNKVIHDDRQHSPALRYTPGFPLVVSLFLVGALSLGLDRWGKAGAVVQKDRAGNVVEASTLLLLFIVTYCASFLPFFVAGRYRVPVIPFLMLFGSYGICRMVHGLVARDWRRPVWYVSAGVALFFAARIPLVPYEPDHTWWHLLRGEAYERRGLIEPAVAEFQAAVQLSPEEKVIHYNLGRNLAALGRLEEAQDRYLQAIQIDPDFAQAHTALGILYGLRDDPESAARHYRAALQAAPRHLPAQYNLGIVLAHLEQFDEAITALQQAAELAALQGRRDLIDRIHARIEAVRAAAASASDK